MGELETDDPMGMPAVVSVEWLGCAMWLLAEKEWQNEQTDGLVTRCEMLDEIVEVLDLLAERLLDEVDAFGWLLAEARWYAENAWILSLKMELGAFPWT